MFKISWIITDDISAVDLNEFNSEWNGIYGYFRLCVNENSVGYCPDRELFSEEEGTEDILYWLYKLADGINELNAEQKYEIQLLSMNLGKIIFKKNDLLEITFAYSDTDETIWHERVTFQEFCCEIVNSIEDFFAVIQKENKVLLGAYLIGQLKEAIQERRKRKRMRFSKNFSSF